MSKAYSTDNKLTFKFFTLKGSTENKNRIQVEYNGCFNKTNEQLGWGENDFEAALCALKIQTYLHLEYKEKYYDLLTKLNNVGFVLKEDNE